MKNKNFEIKNGKGWEGQEVAKGTKIIASLYKKKTKLFSDNLGKIQKKLGNNNDNNVLLLWSLKMSEVRSEQNEFSIWGYICLLFKQDKNLKCLTDWNHTFEQSGIEKNLFWSLHIDHNNFVELILNCMLPINVLNNITRLKGIKNCVRLMCLIMVYFNSIFHSFKIYILVKTKQDLWNN